MPSRAFAAAVLLGALLLAGCVAESTYDALQRENQELRAQNQRLEAQLMALQQEASFVETGDLLFAPGGFTLSEAGKAELRNRVLPKLKGLQNAKIVVYGYTDNTPVGPDLQKQGIPDNLVLSTRRAAEVATFLVQQGVPAPNISVKGFGDTKPVASNDTPQGRAQNRRIEITVQGPGA